MALNPIVATPGSANPAPPPVVQGTQYQPGAPAPIIPAGGAGTPFGNVNNSLLGSGQWGTGQSFQGAAQGAVIPSIEAAMSTQNPADASSMNAVRDYYNKQLYNLPTTQNVGGSAQGQSLAQGANNLQALLGRATGSQGNASPSSYGGTQGSLADRMAQAQALGQNSLVNGAIGQSGAVGTGLQNVNSADQNQLNFNLGQGQTLASAIAQQQQLASGQLAQTQNMQQFSNTMQNANTMDFIMPFGAGAAYLASPSNGKGSPSNFSTIFGGSGASTGSGAGADVGGSMGSDLGGSIGSDAAASSSLDAAFYRGGRVGGLADAIKRGRVA